MEELLNKLIEKGWKPRGFEKIYNFGIENGYTVLDTKKATYISFATSCVFREDYGEEQEMDYVSYTFRELVSKESGLWQFCCKNRLTNRDEKSDWSKNAERDEDGVIDRDCLIFSSDYEYWIIESALKDESELEDFLLSNIKVDGTTK